MLLFRRKKPVQSARQLAWQELAERLELQPSRLNEPFLRTVLALDGEILDPIYSKQVDVSNETVNLYLFDYSLPDKRPLGPDETLVSGCLLSVTEPFHTAIKVSRKLHKVLESLGASASGGEVLTFPEDPAFDARVTVYARDSDAVKGLFSELVRQVFIRALYDRGLAPIFLMGEQHVLLLHTGSSETPTPLVKLEDLTVDLLSLYGYLQLQAR